MTEILKHLTYIVYLTVEFSDGEYSMFAMLSSDTSPERAIQNAALELGRRLFNSHKTVLRITDTDVQFLDTEKAMLIGELKVF